MPKVEIDYSNTIIYKITCKDPLITDLYIGQTTNFVQRKHTHKQACNNIKSQIYNLKLYKTIRDNGNWSNWNMTQVAVYNCKDSFEAKQKEQEYLISLNATLNNMDSTAKHINPKNSIITSSIPLVCICGNKYKDRTGLWKHNKKCIEKKHELEVSIPVPVSDYENNVIKMIIQENSEIKNLILEISKNSVNVTNNNNNNKTFNLQVYLNDDCKDALNITEFVSSIKVEIDELETTGRLGYVEGVSRIINKNLNELEHNRRPIHCSDLKREVLYIKNDDQWVKEDETKPILKRAIRYIANENIKQINEWKKKYPDCTASDSRKNDAYLQIVSNCMPGMTNDEQLKNVNKIISNLAKGSVIDKL